MPELYLWIDLETTGLDPEHCQITEIAAVLTEGPAEGFGYVASEETILTQDPEALWQKTAYEMAQNSGLIDDYGQAKAEGELCSLAGIEKEILSMIATCASLKARIHLAARNVGFEAGFLARYMPTLYKRLHYRRFDVTPLFAIDPSLYDFDVDQTLDADTRDLGPHRAYYDIARDLEYAREFIRRYYGSSAARVEVEG